MRIAIAYPPLRRHGKLPLLSQNRQFRYSSSSNVHIYPVVLASAATLLKRAGHQVLWLDGINERLSVAEFERRLVAFAPDLTVIETKAPIIRDHWRFIDDIGDRFGFAAALVGDHVCVAPQESLAQSQVRYVIASGDCDLALLGVVEHLDRGQALPLGVYHRQNGDIAGDGPAPLAEDLDQLPLIDRDLTRWHIYGEAYLYRPCAYILSGRGCGGSADGPGRCRFCIWQHALWRTTRRLRSPQSVVAEIKHLVERYGVREVFDDNESGAVWNGDWLEEFCYELRSQGIAGKVALSCNARADSLTPRSCRLMQESGFRLLKVGLESANPETLRYLNKDETIDDIVRGVKTAKDHGLAVLMTTMTGYPWETEADVRHTYEVTRELMLYKTQFGDSLQSSVIVPYPGTPLYAEAMRRDWFCVDPQEWERFDMSQPVLKADYDAMAWCDRMWSIHKHPLFVLKTLFRIRRPADIALLWRGVQSLRGHNRDF